MISSAGTPCSSSHWRLGLSAPVGQTPTHCPQKTQVVSGRGFSKKVPIWVSIAAPGEVDGKGILGILGADLHAAPAQDALGVIADEHGVIVDARASARRSASGKRCGSPPYSCRQARISGASERSTLEASISRMVRRARSTRSVRVCTAMPALTWATQAGTRVRAPSTSTTQMRHSALAVQ